MNRPDASIAGLESLLSESTQASAPAPDSSVSLARCWDRVALAISAAERQSRDIWQKRFRGIMDDCQFIPSWRVLQVAGEHPADYMLDCVGIAPLGDSLDGVFEGLRKSAFCLQAGMDVAVDFSSQQPSHPKKYLNGYSGMGPLSLTRLWCAVASVIGESRNEMGLVSVALRCDHPDIESFVEEHGHDGCNLQTTRTVVVSDAFMEAVMNDAEWPLVFPLGGQKIAEGAVVFERVWPGCTDPQPCLVYKRIRARSLWIRMLQAQHRCASMRLLFIEAMQRNNSLWYAEQIHIANALGEVPLAGNAVCVRGTINLARFVRSSVGGHAEIDWQRLRFTVATAVRFLDDVYDVIPHLPKHLAKPALASRRIGLGITGLSSVFTMLGLIHGSNASLNLAGRLMSTIRETAYRMSSDIAREKGSFPAYDKTHHLACATVLDLPHELQDAIAVQGLRNSHLLAVGPVLAQTPTGLSISLGTDPVRPSCGFVHAYGSRGSGVMSPWDSDTQQMVGAGPAEGRSVALHWINTSQVSVEHQLDIASAVQEFVDNAVCVNVYVPESTPAITYEEIFLSAWKRKLRNCQIRRLPG